MSGFINDVLKNLQKKEISISEVSFILPSKRAGIFLKNQLTKIVNETIFSPKIISIEEFVEELSQLKTVPNTELLFIFYNTYKQLTPENNREPFDSFSKWAQILLQDFNEIDRHLIPQEKIFNYLSAIQGLKHWSLEEKKTDFVKSYLNFWNKLNTYYSHFSENLLEKKQAYQGLIYREAVENLESYILSNENKHHIFLGFNALNKAEETIIQELLQQGKADIYWDIDSTFLSNPNHGAGLFIRSHRKNWSFFKKHSFNWVSNFYSEEKKISVYGIPKNVGQAKHIGSIVKELQNKQNALAKTAIVLGDENLLIPILNSLPEKAETINITMGFPLRSIPLASLFEQLLNVHKKDNDKYYYKDVISIFSHQFIKSLFLKDGIDYALKISSTIEANNLIYISEKKLNEITKSNECNLIISLLFGNWKNNAGLALQNCLQIITHIKTQLDEDKSSNLLSLEYLFRFNKLFNEVSLLLKTYNKHITNITEFVSVYNELLNTETLDFQGEPLQGLQIMGMLESRVLDFETVIISSVNEGVLPSGKSNNSFIPFDVKLENNLPTYKEKDAVYTYHFYRLLQRAKNIHILYNTESEALNGGEKSRFITQLELEGIHKIKHQIIASKIPNIQNDLRQISKTKDVLMKLEELSIKGFSPSSLTSYIRNPIDFYYQKILKINELKNVEETVAANTLGTVVHNTLEDFYKPLIGKNLTENSILEMKKNIDKTVTLHFKKEYKEGNISKGKNLIIYEIAKRYVYNFLNLELKDLQQENQIKIIAIESNSTVTIPIHELGFPVNLTGKVDRVDEYNGITRIIDYKTGRVEQSKVEIVNWEELTTDYTKYSKSFQVLAYAYMMHLDSKINLPVEAGIVSFKNLNSGFLKFGKKESVFSRTKNQLISLEILNDFEIELKKLILEICNPDIDFIEKEV